MIGSSCVVKFSVVIILSIISLIVIVIIIIPSNIITTSRGVGGASAVPARLGGRPRPPSIPGPAGAARRRFRIWNLCIEISGRRMEFQLLFKK